ncbi:MAG: glycyl-radical enzyme activating protein [Bacteroidaceae bacterium]|nr:glycyl-radical enzyme activating protein [Bacteroidaceae bacterium]
MIVFDIKRYAINDGPGIRTTLFAKGCPLRCVWCHNPESWRPQPEWLFKRNKCIGCNSCGIYPHQLEYISSHLPSDDNLIPDSGKADSSLSSCPTLALEVCGRQWSIDELMAEVEKEREIMVESGGGVTISGGEPLMQASEIKPLLAELGRRGLHRALDTTLYAKAEVVQEIAPLVDLFLVDLKVMADEKHRRVTGVSNRRILDNIRMLAQIGAVIQFRIPLIEGINADEENIEATATFIKALGPKYAEGHTPLAAVALLPYHEMGRDKHSRRGTHYNPDNIPLAIPSDTTIDRCISQFAKHGITVYI